MKKTGKNLFKGFSLVELMISLIAISLISAAFVPIITKKLSSMGITIGSFGSHSTDVTGCTDGTRCNTGYYLNSECVCKPCNVDNCNNCDGNGNYCKTCKDGFESDGNGGCVSKECIVEDTNGNVLSRGVPSEKCCKSVGAVFISAEKSGTTNGLCMMKYNPGDYDEENLKNDTNTYKYDLNYPKIGVSLIRGGKLDTCKKDNYCCWKNATSPSDTDVFYSYSGINRTVCQQNAAANICSNWAYGGTKAGAWRLPTQTELKTLYSVINNETQSTSSTNLVKYKDNLGLDGLQLCNGNTATSGVANCQGAANNCSGAASSGSNGNYCGPWGIWAANEGVVLRLLSGKADVNTGYPTDRAFSVRCVSENVYSQVTTPIKEIAAKSDTEPLEESEDSSRLCPDGTMYINGLYTGGKSICMMKYNAGDDVSEYANYHPEYAKIGVQLVDIGTTDNACRKIASSSTEKDVYSCCWWGQTSPNGIFSPLSNVSKYDPKLRTVCTKRAADRICENWGFNGKVGIWRLPTTDELTNLAKYINSDGYFMSYFSKYVNNSGLQLCDENSTDYGSSQCPGASGKCSGAASSGSNGNYCGPWGIWANNDGSVLKLQNGIANMGSDYNANRAFGVRCVTDKIAETVNETKQVVDTNEPESQADCDPYNAIFINRKYLNKSTNEEIKRNICMMRYNFGDYDAKTQGKPYYEDYMALQSSGANDGVNMYVAGVSGQTCKNNYCCWMASETTSTSNNASGDYSYSGATRTLCTQLAAKKICANWAPDTAQNNEITSNSKWRLLDKAEAEGLAFYLNMESSRSYFLSKYLDKKNSSSSAKGLQLCDETSINYGTNMCPGVASKCSGAASSGSNGNYCGPWGIWANNDGYVLKLQGGLANMGSGYANNRAFGVRCVTDTIKK